MSRKRYGFVAVALLAVAGWTQAQAQERTVGLFVHDEGAFEGYTMVAPLFFRGTFLIDNDGQLVHAWSHDIPPGAATYVLPSGHLLRGGWRPNPWITFGGLGGLMQEIDWDGNVVWEFEYSDSLHALHHDMAVLPNGNILMIAWEYKSAEEAVAAGRDPDSMDADALWPEQLIEVRPTPPNGGEIVWKWHVWDHLIQDFDATKANFGVVEDHPELIDLNFAPTASADWLHMNAVNYNAELDQIIMSVPGFNEAWVIDHSTTTEEAAGHTGGRYGQGGDLLYRWGNPETYRAGPPSARQLSFQHDVQWIEPGLPGAGNILIFNNGLGRRASSVLELAPPLDETGAYHREPDGSFANAEEVWRYEDPGVFFSGFASGAQRLPNGNTLIAEAQNGRIFEVTPEGQIVWQYVNPVTDQGPLTQGEPVPPGPTPVPTFLANSIFRAYRYGVDLPGLQDKDLTPQGPIEVMPTAAENTDEVPADFVLFQNFPNPFNPTTAISFTVPRASVVTLTVHNVLGQRVRTLADGRYPPGTHVVRFDADGLPSGVYVYRLEAERFSATKTMLLVK